MKLAAVVVVGSLLVTPVAFAQSAQQSVQIPKDATPKASVRDADFYEPPPREPSDTATGSFDDTDGNDPRSGPPSSLKGSFDGTDPTNVETSFQEDNTND